MLILGTLPYRLLPDKALMSALYCASSFGARNTTMSGTSLAARASLTEANTRLSAFISWKKEMAVLSPFGTVSMRWNNFMVNIVYRTV